MSKENRSQIQLRTHKCPVCGKRSLIGYDLNPRPVHIEFSSILRPQLPEGHRVYDEDGPVELTDMDLIHLYICPHDLALHRGRYRVGMVRGGLAEEIDWEAKRTLRSKDRRTMLERNLLQIFMRRKGEDAPGILARRAARAGLIGSDPGDFEILELTARLEQLITASSTAEYEDLSRTLNRSLSTPLPSLVLLESYRDLDSVQTLLDLERIYLMESLARENGLEISDELFVNTLEMTTRFVQVIYDSPVLEPWSLRRLLTNLLATAQVLGQKEQASYNALLAARRCVICILRFGDVSYDDPNIIAARVEQNNEAVRYLYLVLRKMLGGELESEPDPEKIQERLEWALQSSGAYSFYGRTKGVAKAVRMGELLKKHIDCYLREGVPAQ